MPAFSDDGGTQPSHNHSFGGSVALLESGEEAVAPQLFVGAHGWAEYTGAVYVFQRRDRGVPRESDGRVWLQTQTLVAAGGAAGDRFGLQVCTVQYGRAVWQLQILGLSRRGLARRPALLGSLFDEDRE